MAYLEGNRPTYKTGTWTPTITSSATNPTVTYTSQNGTYTRFGNTVMIQGQLQINTISGGSGTIRVSIPISSSSTAIFNWGSIMTKDINYPFGFVVGYIESEVAYFSMRAIQDNGGVTDIVTGDVSAGDRILFTFNYAV